MSPPIPQLAYRGNPTWLDMSEYAVHFTKPGGLTSAYDVMLSILSEGFIRPTGPLGAARNLNGRLNDSQSSACFSEVPFGLLDRLMRWRSKYGIGFRQQFLTRSGGARVWYIDRDGTVAAHFREIVRRSMLGGIDRDEPIWNVTPFVENPGVYGETEYRFEWEREWRAPGGLRFTPRDVAFLFVSEELHGAARAFFEDVERDNEGPVYRCPYVDPSWDIERIRAEFEAIPRRMNGGPPRNGLCPYCGYHTLDGQCMDCGEHVP